MTTEESVAALTTATTALLTAVGTQQTAVNTALVNFNSVITRVNSGLNNVNNTADVNKEVSTPTNTALELRQLKLKDIGTGKNFGKINGFSLLDGTDLVVQRSPTSVNRLTYDGRAAIRSLSATTDDSTIIQGLGIFQFSTTTAEPDDDETCFTTANGTKALDGITPVIGQWLLEAPAWDLVDAWIAEERAITDDWREDEPTRFAAYLLTNK